MLKRDLDVYQLIECFDRVPVCRVIAVLIEAVVLAVALLASALRVLFKVDGRVFMM